jgi:hypothetical protein
LDSKEGSPVVDIWQRVRMLTYLKQLAAARAEAGTPDAGKAAALKFLRDSKNKVNPALFILTTAAREYNRTGVELVELDTVGRASADLALKKLSVEAVELKTTSGGR